MFLKIHAGFVPGYGDLQALITTNCAILGIALLVDQ